jgi:hypothetical protein
MKNYHFLLTGIAVLLASCQSNVKKETVIDSATQAVIDTAKSSEQCYSMLKNRDTAMISLKITGNKVTGTALYNLYEKDKNKGTIAGTIVGDTILADYTFQSEGTQSVREVAFLIKDNKLLEGFGEVKEGNSKATFKDPKRLVFGNAMAFSKTVCK